MKPIGGDTMENREERVTFLLTDKERVTIENAATERGKNLSELIRDAVEFYASFPVALIEQLKKATVDIKMDIYEIVPRLLLVYIATDAAIVKNFGISKTFERAFRFGPDGKLLEGSELSDKTFEEVDKVCKEVLKKMKWIAAGKQTLLNREEGSYVPVLQEVQSKPMASAKGK